MSLPFEAFERKAWPFWYKGEMVVKKICGGIPANENTAKSWIETKLKDTRSTEEVQRMVEKTKQQIRDSHAAAVAIAEAEAAVDGSTLVRVGEDIDGQELHDQAVAKAAQDMAGLNMFWRTSQGQLYVEGRQLKAALKEAVSVAANAGKLTTKGWGNPDNAAYKKQLKAWFPEHVFVVGEILPLFREDGTPVTKPDGILQKFVHTHRGDAIGYEEYVENALIRFRVKTDVELTMRDWAMIWLTGQDQGLGASRSQGFGTYTVTEWDQVK